jgi:hypothetical protein
MTSGDSVGQLLHTLLAQTELLLKLISVQVKYYLSLGSRQDYVHAPAIRSLLSCEPARLLVHISS